MVVPTQPDTLPITAVLNISDASSVIQHENVFQTFIAKYNTNGELVWPKYIGGDTSENGTAIIVKQ
ncbi:hypothetical protein [Flavobacterium wongokense]|uniref:hypothetical protein n=1 Tax=Flavobacterium wongokense TaxID=2910674 RepID=UPI001F31D62B|nr:hypothetical protein [Flavobacterium sp. WG47]MCF6132800.1 hypothetical protein [Flavobacterium sp. WG47]